MREKIHYFIILLFMSIVFTIGYCMNQMMLNKLSYDFMLFSCCGLFVYNFVNWILFVKNNQYKRRVDAINDLYIDFLIPIFIFVFFFITDSIYEFVTYGLYILVFMDLYSFRIIRNKFISISVFGGLCTLLIFLINNLYRLLDFIHIFSYSEILIMDLKYGVGRYIFVFLLFVGSCCLMNLIINNLDKVENGLYRIQNHIDQFLYEDIKKEK